MGTPRAPAGLGAAGRRLWRDVLAVYELAPGELEMLRQAARAADVITRLDAELAHAPGLTTVGSTGQPRSHPLLDSLATQRRVLAECIRSMALPFPDEERGRRRTPAAAESARERWRQRGAG